jgi:hypothetical protein
MIGFEHRMEIFQSEEALIVLAKHVDLHLTIYYQRNKVYVCFYNYNMVKVSCAENVAIVLNLTIASTLHIYIANEQ